LAVKSGAKALTANNSQASRVRGMFKRGSPVLGSTILAGLVDQGVILPDQVSHIES